MTAMMDEPELVSVVMPTYCRLSYLRRAVESVFAQTWPHWELLIADDGSDAATRAYLSSRCTDRRVGVEFLPHSGIPARVRNTALRRARGAYVAFLDSDDSWLPDKLGKQLALMRPTPQFRWSYTAFVGVDGADEPLGGVHRHRWVPLSGDIFPDLLTGRATVRIGTVLCTRELLAAVGPFDEAIESGEDYELYMRLSLASGVAVLDEELLLFRRHEENVSSRLRAPYADRQYVLAKALRRTDARWHADIRRERARSHVAHVSELLASGAGGAALRAALGSAPQGWNHACWWRGMTARLLRAGLRACRKRLVDAAAVAAEACLRVAHAPPPATLLILAHMRSGSTLLLHLLLMSEEIAGLGERNAVYRSAHDLSRLAVATRIAGRAPFRRLRYVADQINHNGLTPDLRVLNEPRVRILFLLRQPQPAIASLIELSRHYFSDSWSVGQAVDYYVRRVQVLAEVAGQISNPGCAGFVTYEELVESPQKTLDKLREFLGLQGTLSPEYRTYSFTRRRGDRMPNIASGEIRRTQAPTSVNLSAAESERVMSAYRQCNRALGRFALP